jgi:hypothetical protein
MFLRERITIHVCGHGEVGLKSLDLVVMSRG